MRRAAAVLFVLASMGAQAAQPIYRCGPDGRTYSQAPCADGRLIDAADPRSEAERVEARRVAARERNLAADLERERRAREAAKEPATASGFDARPQPAPAVAMDAPRSKAKGRGAKAKKKVNEDFVAVEPRSPKSQP